TRPLLFCGVRTKYTKILAFKGGAQNDESGSRSSRSKYLKNSVKISYVPPHEDEETLTESPDLQEPPVSYSSEGAEETTAGSAAIQKLFKKWLLMLQTQSSNQATDGIFGEEPVHNEIIESHIGIQKQEGNKRLKLVWCYFLGLHATIKIPLLFFVPLYLAVNVLYGAEVSKELTPLWVLGPLILALYVKMVRWIFALYVFSFKHTVRIVKSLPSYSLSAYNCISQGKLKEDLHAHFRQPAIDIKNLNYKALLMIKLKQLQVLAVEKYLDLVESIWPYYCRTIRFLKKANLI
ncbi:hypothetical protein GIB67_002889, partial [Kingdonia uniflora]